MIFLGEIAALGSAFLFTGSSVLFSLAGRRTDAGTVNRFRLAIALVFMVTLHWFVIGDPLPLGEPAQVWIFMALSGFVGLYLGDTLLFEGFVRIGPRLSMLIFALAPILAALMGWFFLEERLAVVHWVGIAVTVFGVGLVASEPVKYSPPAPPETTIETNRSQMTRSLSASFSTKQASGLLFALGGAAGQAGGLILAKFGLSGNTPAMSGNVMRLAAAAITIWLVTLLQGRLRATLKTLASESVATRQTTFGAVLGPVVGVWLSLVAVQRAPVGIASALMSLTPIFLIPLARIVFYEVITKRAIIGTLVAVGGSALLFL